MQDVCHGLKLLVFFNILFCFIIVDTTLPTISNCPNEASTTVELGISVGQVVWIEPIASDISGVAILRERTAAPGDLFPVGQSAVTYTFVDASSNEASCTIIVTVTPGKSMLMVAHICSTSNSVKVYSQFI